MCKRSQVIFIGVDQSRLKKGEPAIIIHNEKTNETKYVYELTVLEGKAVQENGSVKIWIDDEKLLEY